MINGFKNFLLRGNVVDLAVAVVIGAAFTAIVNSFVSDILTPFIAAIGGRPDFSALTLRIGGGEIKYGLFLNALISFLMVAAVIYFLVVRPYEKISSRFARQEESVMRDCPECLSEIPRAAARCSQCTAQVTPVL
ncbi:large conductance mechanosensitive channel protein MscL [Streptosporangium saharense]|uniref:Large-conductance mechanosensitive channel n=1 Tax=Streptosporangium saharense TaxID=1706840 RepID=A0A7W7QQC0_9ACTN|nr:large conductance mechanosensitive channel protein MscL [Streptosporangium saharense]MBB4917748.1 large conductance mechanosensitive channel [Streptosporangium saharense]